MKIGSLFSGAGGLDMAVESVLDARTVWHAEIDLAASKVLAHNFPDVPNLGDVSAVDWSTVEPVDVLTGGFPCQDLSLAGKRAGLRDGTRSGLWNVMADAIYALRPGLVVIENVRGLLSAEAHSDVEPCPWCLGDGAGSGLRALGAVLGDLADLGYDAQWHGLRAADVGAPHGRFRVFIVAYAADAADLGHERSREARHGRTGSADSRGQHAADTNRERLARSEPDTQGRPGTADDARRRGIALADTCRAGLQGARAGGRGQALTEPVGDLHASPDTAGDGRHEGRAESARLVGRPDAAERSHAAADAERGGRDGRTPDAQRGPLGGTATAGSGEADRRDGAAAHAPSGSGQDEPLGGDQARQHERAVAGAGRGDRSGHPAEGVRDVGRTAPVVAWGPYEPAIRRWEHTLGRVAPSPTDTAPKGGQRLSPRFVEWMMGLPAGWVTDVDGVIRNEQLKMLGNGVVPQQAAAAIRAALAMRVAS